MERVLAGEFGPQYHPWNPHGARREMITTSRPLLWHTSGLLLHTKLMFKTFLRVTGLMSLIIREQKCFRK